MRVFMSFDQGGDPPGVPFDLGNAFFYAEISGPSLISWVISDPHHFSQNPLPFSIIAREHPPVP
jgi:hypothetical protein